MKLFLPAVSLVFLLLLASPVHAAKPRVRKTHSVRTTTSGGSSYSSARLSRATNSVVITLLNLKGVSRVSYALQYTSNGIAQGVVGSLVPTGQSSESRDLYFGTCSKGVCTPHYNIRNATLLVQTTLTSGTVHSKRYRIRI